VLPLPDITQATACHVAYEPGFTWWFPAAGLVVALGGAGLAFVMKGWKRIFAATIVGFALLWVLAAATSIFGRYAAARRAATSPDTPFVEGLVQDFHPAPREGHENESFAINGIRFFYSDYVITGGFRQTASHGGPIREGLHVRIHYLPDFSPYVGNLIVKLDVCP
jgi:hypothetical protein